MTAKSIDHYDHLYALNNSLDTDQLQSTETRGCRIDALDLGNKVNAWYSWVLHVFEKLLTDQIQIRGYTPACLFSALHDCASANFPR